MSGLRESKRDRLMAAVTIAALLAFVVSCLYVPTQFWARAEHPAPSVWM